jgi:hypothetical protein
LQGGIPTGLLRWSVAELDRAVPTATLGKATEREDGQRQPAAPTANSMAVSAGHRRSCLSQRPDCPQPMRGGHRRGQEVTAEDVDRVVGAMAVGGKASSTRRDYVPVFKGFHRFLTARKAAEIEGTEAGRHR